ncbi:MAG: MBL fold metallo-hydrolase [Roseburia sp.]|nr:MBL fold metallo-hydrolase [Roseburia sp.]
MSLKMCAFASGSKGNCCYVSDGTTELLIDLGISATRAEKCLSLVGADPDRVDIFVTHAHSDHIGGLKIFCKKHPTAHVYCQRECAYAVGRGAEIAPTVADRSVAIGGLKVTALPVPHDVPCFGYIVESDGKKVAVVTDIGVVEAGTLDGLRDCDIVMLEANHDPLMLKNNRSYTPVLKARISSSHGHLSNGDCAAACAFLASCGVKNFILAHLSEQNNAPLVASSAVERAIADAGVTDAHVAVATQNAMTGLFEVC